MNVISIKIYVPEDIAIIFAKSIGQETKTAIRRSEIELRPDEHGLEIEIKSDDLHALRASVNTYLRWLIMCFNLISEKNNT